MQCTGVNCIEPDSRCLYSLMNHILCTENNNRRRSEQYWLQIKSVTFEIDMAAYCLGYN